MYCPRQNNILIKEKSQAIAINGTARGIEYSLMNQCTGPLSSSPPNSWCQRLQLRCKSY